MSDKSVKYNFKIIEKTWRSKWYKDNIYEAVDFSEKPKKYILAELPYPSGKFLHIGHMMRYTVPEMYSRYLRMQGYNVLYPMGWDSFGLPAETFAIKEHSTPQEVISQATKDYKVAMQSMGYAIDWNREINTSDPQYYKWTQWMFIKFWEAGLAEVKEMPVWWCQELGVLADEEVLSDGKGGKMSERGEFKVEKKMFKQWVLKIPEYAEKLLDGLNEVDYMDSVRQGQINWIGKNEGAMTTFEISGEAVKTFTTRPDTIFGVTFLAVSPQHELIEKLKDKIQNYDEIQKYVEAANNLSDLEKQTKEKTGVLLKGITGKHPLNGKDMPVFVADYIVLDYGTGVVMGVPGHDERDYEFAEKYDLEIIEVIESPKDFEGKVYDGEGKMVNSGEYDGKNSEEFKKIITERIEKEGLGGPSKQYKLRDQVFSRQRYWGEPMPLIHKEDGSVEAVAEDDLPLELPVMRNFQN